MNVFEDLVLVTGAKQILLLKYLSIVMLAIYLPYIGLLTGSTTFSLIFGMIGRRSRNERYERLSRGLMEIAVPHTSVLAALALLPMIAITFIHAQILHQVKVMTPTFLLANAIALFFGILMICIYRATWKARQSTGAGFAIHMLSGIVGLLLLLKAQFVHVAAMTLVYDPGMWAVITSPLKFLFSWNVIARFALHTALAMVLTGVAVIFFHLHWKKRDADAGPFYRDFVVTFGKWLAIPFALLTPPLVFWNIVTLPEVSLSINVFFFSLLALVVLMMTARALLKAPTAGPGVDTFVLAILAFFVVITADHFTRENTLREQTTLLAARSAEGESGMEGVPGILRSRGCLSCHTIDGKPFLGPTFKGIFERETVVVKNGVETTLKADEAYIKRSILDPTSEVVKTFQPVMPPQKLTDEELKEIIEFFKKLK